MAEERTIDQVMPKKLVAEDGDEKIEPENDDEKANPIEAITLKKGPPKILPRYLSGPQGSCHDLCKYGIQHAIEAKPWITSKKRVIIGEKKTKIVEENVTTKKLGSSAKPSLASKCGKTNCLVDIKEIKNGKTVTSDKNSLSFEETDASMEHHISDIRQARSESYSLPLQEGSKSQTKREIVKNKCAFGSSSRKETEIRSIQTRTSLTGVTEKSKPPIPLSPKYNVKKTSSPNAKTAKNLRGVSFLKSHETVEEAKPELESNGDVPDKILHVIEPTSADLSEETTEACDASKLFSASPSSSEEKSLHETSKKTSKSGVSASSTKGLRHGTSSTVSVPLSPLSSGNKGKKNMQHKAGSTSQSPSVRLSISTHSSSSAKESVASTSKSNKSGHKTSNASRSPSSSISLSTTSRGKRNPATTSKSNKTGHGSPGETMKIGYKIRSKLSTIVGATNKVVPARKLTFRRGKVIQVQPQNSNIPRRLKFKPARLLSDDSLRSINSARKRIITCKEGGNCELNAASIKPEKVVFKLQTGEGSKRRIVGRRVIGDRSKIEGTKSGSEKVVLRHQNVEGKKVNPRLYNNVIEETATMLAELRKSKVKALVGAFETVISLDSPRAEATHTEISTAC